jgi:hypothetical protein
MSLSWGEETHGTMSRAEHLAWAKARALEYVGRGDLVDAVALMVSDMNNHPELNVDSMLAYIGASRAQDNDVAGVRHWIEDFK